MQNSAFKTLGIEPTADGRVIRNAFLRVARIYHPDRFAGQPSDVRAEAERRMKEAAAAYEALRAWKRGAVKAPEVSTPPTDVDAWEKAKRARQIVTERRAENERNQARWQLWAELERQARQRAEWDAQLAAVMGEDQAVQLDASPPPAPSCTEPIAESSFSRRLEEAKAKRSSLVRRVQV